MQVVQVYFWLYHHKYFHNLRESNIQPDFKAQYEGGGTNEDGIRMVEFNTKLR
jgi:hypothetical protein